RGAGGVRGSAWSFSEDLTVSAIFGFAGAVAPHSHVGGDLDAMSKALRPRGPDGEVQWISGADRVALGFRFLRTGAAETTPGILVNEDRSLTMVCDGHIFNDDMLRPILRDRGHSVGQHSCDLLLHLYEEEGVAGWQRADGQFALALWDARKKQFLLARDCLGLRALYYWTSGGVLVFASEIKALLQHGLVPRAVDETAVADFLTFTSVPGPRTLFRDVRKVPPASAIVLAAN